jgi:hypothetical protein
MNNFMLDASKTMALPAALDSLRLYDAVVCHGKGNFIGPRPDVGACESQYRRLVTALRCQSMIEDMVMQRVMW